jgi:hypothetical protein
MSGDALDRVMDGRAWAAFCDRLKAAGEVVLGAEAAPLPLDRAEGWRYLSRLTRLGLEMMVECADPDFPTLYSATTPTIKVGGDNPDNLYQNATISGARRYRIRGRRGTVTQLSFGSKANRLATTGLVESTGELDARDLRTEPDGRFEITVAATPQPGNWLPLAPDSTMLLIRQTFLDRAAETPADIVLECVDGPALPPPLAPERLDRGLAAAGAFVEVTARTFLQWADLFRRQPNQLPAQDQGLYQRTGGAPEIHYLHGWWQLAPDEALVIRTRVPDCVYWNFVLQNVWMESMDYRFLPAHLNKHTAVPDEDGRVTILVAAQGGQRPPSAFRNVVDTAGHAHGTMLLRWVGATDHPVPECRVVRLADL